MNTAKISFNAEKSLYHVSIFNADHKVIHHKNFAELWAAKSYQWKHNADSDQAIFVHAPINAGKSEWEHNTNISASAYKAKDNQPLESAINVLGIVDGAIRELLTLRIYHKPYANTKHCLIWLHCGDYRSASGSAHACGSPDDCAAIADCLERLNIETVNSVNNGVYEDVLKMVVNHFKPDAKSLYIVQN